MTMKPCFMLAIGTVLAGLALAGCSGTATGSRTAGPGAHAVGSATSVQTPAASGTSAAAPASTAASTAAVTACVVSDLRVSVDGSASESLNHGAGTELKLTNSSRHACALDGYPGLRLLDSRHQVLPTLTHRGRTWWANDPGHRPVDLAPGQAALAALAWTDAGSSAVSASYLEVTLPSSTTHLTINFRKLVDGGNLDVTALGRTVSIRLQGFGGD
jgi:uncharacterized protein DUF4232